jgi:phosphomannomutase
MRGSGTEPVFRVMAEFAGGGEAAVAFENELITWQREMVMEADKDLSGGIG